MPTNAPGRSSPSVGAPTLVPQAGLLFRRFHAALGIGAVAKRCPKCSYVSPADPIMCPACGVIYGEIESATDVGSATIRAIPRFSRRRRWLQTFLPIFRHPHDRKTRRGHSKRRLLHAVAICGTFVVTVGRAFHLRKSGSSRAPSDVPTKEYPHDERLKHIKRRRFYLFGRRVD